MRNIWAWLPRRGAEGHHGNKLVGLTAGWTPPARSEQSGENNGYDGDTPGSKPGTLHPTTCAIRRGQMGFYSACARPATLAPAGFSEALVAANGGARQRLRPWHRRRAGRFP